MQIRVATHADIPALKMLINDSVRQLGVSHYTAEQAEAALQASFFGVDTELLDDETYFVIEDAGRFAACGGWSRRKTLFGGDGASVREAGYLDPTKDAAKIRAFFVHPDYARRGLGKQLLAHCETQARAHGFRAFVMMATLSGVDFYSRCGYLSGEQESYDLPGGLRITGQHMHKTAA